MVAVELGGGDDGGGGGSRRQRTPPTQLPCSSSNPPPLPSSSLLLSSSLPGNNILASPFVLDAGTDELEWNQNASRVNRVVVGEDRISP